MIFEHMTMYTFKNDMEHTIHVFQSTIQYSSIIYSIHNYLFLDSFCSALWYNCDGKSFTTAAYKGRPSYLWELGKG